MTTESFLSLALMALLGSGHCIGMCGVFAMSAGGSGSWSRIFLRQIAYQSGKALAYVFIAVVLALAVRWASWINGAQNLLSVIVGGWMLVLGIGYALEWRPALPWLTKLETAPICGALFAVASAPTTARAFLIGWLNGFLPCGLSIAAVAYAASFGDASTAALGAVVFGFCTLPGLFLAALLGGKISIAKRRLLVRLAGVTLAAMGIFTMVRGVPEVHEQVHRWLVF